MTEKRFTDVEVDKYYGLICMNHDGQFHSYSEQSLEDLLNALHEENEMRKEHQRTLEDKIRRLKDRVKTFEKHYSLKDIERLRGD